MHSLRIALLISTGRRLFYPDHRNTIFVAFHSSLIGKNLNSTFNKTFKSDFLNLFFVKILVKII